MSIEAKTDRAKENAVPAETTFGDEVIRGLRDLPASVKAGEPITYPEVRLDLNDDDRDDAPIKVTPSWQT